MHITSKDTKDLQIQSLFHQTKEFSWPELIWIENATQISLGANTAYEIQKETAALCILTVIKGYVQLEELKAKLYQGQSILLSSESNSHMITDDAPAQCMLVCLKGGLLDMIQRQLMQNQTVFCPKGLADLRECVRKVCGSTSDEQNSAAAYHLMMRIHETAQTFVETEGLPVLAEAAMGIMQEEFAQIYGVGEVAERLGVSTEHLTRIFSRALGISPGRFLRQRKLECAKELLKQSEITVSLAAQLSGFSDVNYFSRVFQKEVGMLPSIYHGSHHTDDRSNADICAMIDTMYL